MKRARKHPQQIGRQGIARDRYTSTRGWCGKTIPDDAALFTVGVTVKAKDGVGSKMEKEDVIGFALSDGTRTISGFAPPAGSNAKKKGEDIVFWLCSERCPRKSSKPWVTP